MLTAARLAEVSDVIAQGEPAAFKEGTRDQLFHGIRDTCGLMRLPAHKTAIELVGRVRIRLALFPIDDPLPALLESSRLIPSKQSRGEP